MQQRQRALAWIGGAAVLAGILVVGGRHAGAQTPEKTAEPSLFTDTFDTDLGSWTALGPGGKLALTTDAAHIKSGKGALEFAYNVGGKADAAPPAGADAANLPVSILMRPTPDGALTKMRSLRFWARTDDDIPLAVFLSEKGGGRYVTLVWLPKDTWQQVTLAPGDFWLTDDKNDPPDPDGKLDLDKVENVSLLNLWGFLAVGAGDKADSLPFLAKHLGAHTLWLDDFTASTEPLAVKSPVPADKGLVIDDLQREPLTWLPLGDAQMRRDTSGTPLKGPALRLDYTQAKGNFAALIHDLHRFDLSKTDRLTFEAASQHNATLIVQLEEKGGAKYNATVELPADSMVTSKTVSFADFKIADDSPQDSDGHLDLDQLKTLSIIDVTGFLSNDQTKNTLWIGPIHALPPAP